MTDPRLVRLRVLLQKALEVELFTIPPYLTALYSIKEGTNADSVKIIQSVVMEEMLHATLVANVMNAVGAAPLVSPELSGGAVERFYYPSNVPHVNIKLEIGLAGFSKDVIRSFRTIEAPENPKDWKEASRRGEIHSIGHLYEIVLGHLITITGELGEEVVFSGDRERQIGPEQYYGAGGRVTRVHGLMDAKSAILEVAQEGEGRVEISNLTGDEMRFHQPNEVAHYYRFEQILAGRYYDRGDDLSLCPSGQRLLVDWSSIYKIMMWSPDNPSSPSGLREMIQKWDRTYCELLKAIHRGFNGAPEALERATATMHKLKYETVELMKIDIGHGERCGPPFWFVKMTRP